MGARSFIFDLNGTMINDMEYHVRAWYQVLNEELNAGLSWDEVKSHMYGKNEELLVRVFGKDRFTREQTDRISSVKEKKYQEAFRPHLELIAGLPAFLQRAKKAGIPMAIGSAAIPLNIDFVLDNLDIRHYFSVIVSAHDVIVSKPDPETYLRAAELLDAQPADCLVFEDAPKGVEAALRAGMKCIVLTTMHEREEFGNYPNVAGIVRDYTDPLLNDFFL
ncbi:MAG: HAD family phosphatase [Bacteroidota bacterium]|nr:HAD family phosphatase [Bacteroidota bacterium]MDP4214571.1 HAD family phosphatase [Bacteroidota bacterium]MDP4245628.1 HAD family phosphatase [Bacteroidota bacterium]MDP4255723.1 HAD family phosphatase [Bacteroidota bacterium]MDP4257874.1 HAD family phosphatase [Bacteroidota bacterium]